MADPSDTQYIEPDDALQRRTQGPNGISGAEAVAEAQSAIEEKACDYRAKLEADLDALEKGGGDGQQAPEALYTVAMEIKSLAATFGYRYTGKIAETLCGYLREAPADDPKRSEVLRGHLDAMRYLLEHDGPDDNGAAAELVAQLQTAVQNRMDALGR